MRLSVIMPVYNEIKTIKEIIARVCAVDIEKEMIIVDDFSSDGTREFLKTVDSGQWSANHIKVIFHEKNQGKGAAVRTGLERVAGDVAVIQDADLEYDPSDYVKLMEPIISGKADVVYGSRFLSLRYIVLPWNYIANKVLNLVTNVLFFSSLTDMETCYKMFRTEIMKGISLKSRGFELEPEITAKILKKGIRITEVPVSYYSRKYSEGKKITWRDGFHALWSLIKYRITD